MKARALISAASYGPEMLKIIFQAFDGAWAEIAHYFEGHPTQEDAARERLAHAVLAVADEHSKDPESLKRTALKVLSMSYGRVLGLRLPSTH
ncbi:MAG TPA: hypothetical protein VH519_11705 [Hyphomicrobiaceae bacterium]|jgi:hypothetical protein